MLNKTNLKSDLQDIFDDLSDKSGADRAKEIGKAIQTYLEDAIVGMPPVGTASGVNFPGAGALPSLIQIPPPSAAAASLFELTFTSALMTACAASLGNMDGTPISPGTAIVSEIGMPPIIPVILAGAFSTNDQSSEDAAGKIADAIHTSATSILFTVIVLVPSPAGPVPTPIPGIQIK